MGLVAPFDGPERKERISAAARSWIMAVAENPAVEPECAAWRAAHPDHEAAWRDANAVWQQAAALGTLGREDWRAEIDRMTAPASPRYARFAAAAAMVSALGLAAHSYMVPDFQAETRTAEIRKLALSDGSQVTLSALSGVAVRFEDGSRRVVLNHGQAFFEVAHDQGRPFTVVAGDAEIRVTGTKFDVRRVGEDIQVVVKEGRVELRRKGVLPILTPRAPDRVLTAGFKSELAPGASRFTPEEQAQVTAGEWRNGRLYYNEAPLSDIIADAQRFSSIPIRIEDPAVARMKVTTSFRATQFKPFLDNLQLTMPIQHRRAANGTLLIEAREADM